MFTLMADDLILKKILMRKYAERLMIDISDGDNMWPAIAYGTIMAARFALGVMAVRGQSQVISGIYLIPYYDTEVKFYP